MPSIVLCVRFLSVSRFLTIPQCRLASAGRSYSFPLHRIEPGLFFLPDEGVGFVGKFVGVVDFTVVLVIHIKVYDGAISL